MFEQFSSAIAIPHGYCLSWQSGLLWLHVISDALIAMAYIAIPTTIYIFIRRKHQYLMHQNLFWLFAAFIIACAMTHLMGVVVIWQPYYLLQGLIMAVTAAISLITGLVLARQLPVLLKMPTVSQLQAVNQQLAEQIAHSQALEKKLRLTQFSIDSASEGIFWIKADASIVYANHAAWEFLGYTATEFSGLTVPDINPNYNHQAWPAHWQELKACKTLTFESSLRKKDGDLCPVEITANFIEYEDVEYHCSFVRDISQQKKTQQALETSELMLRQAQEIAHVGHWIYDVKTHKLYWSDEVYRIFGLQPQEIEPSYQEFVHPDDKELVKQSYARHLKNHAGYDLVYRLLLKNGTVKYVNAKARLEVDSQGEVQRSVGVLFDITEQKQAEQALETSELMLRQAHEIAHLGHWRLDLTSNSLYWSDEIYRIFGLEPNEFAPSYQAFLDYVHPEDRDKVNQTYRNHLTDKNPYEIVHRLLLKNGTIKYVNEKCKTEFDSQGQSLQSLGVVFDITAQKQAEQQIKDLLDLNQKIISQSAAGVKVFNTGGQCIACNEAAAKTLDKSIELVLQENFHDLQLWQTTHLKDTAIKCLQSKQPQRQEIHATLVTGKEVWLDYHFATFSSNHEPHLLVLIHDISEYRMTEAALQQARLEAIDANQAKSDFLANMSHEIRTPMNAIIGMSHLMLKTELDRKQLDFMKKIQLSSRHLLGIINDILDFSKIEAGKLLVEHTEFDLELVLDSVITLMLEKASAKALELVLEVEPAVPAYLIGDPMRLGQILLNYANNAVKFTESGHIVIEIRVKEQNEENILLYFAVHDTGIGLTEEQRGLLFQSFQQADTSISRKYGGSGLGLMISKRLAELMGGEVGLTSEYGKGSIFWFTARFGKSAKQKPQLLPEPDLRGRKILVVDDNNSGRDVFCKRLENMSFQPRQVDSGLAALEELRLTDQNYPYEIVFLNSDMPEMDGIETARQILAMQLVNPPHLVMVTAFEREELIAEAQAAGIAEILVKPISPSMLFDTIIHLLNGQETERFVGIGFSSSVFERLKSIQGAKVLLVEDNELNQEVAVELLKEVHICVDVAENGEIAVQKVQEHEYDIVLMDMQMPVMDGVRATQAIRALPGFADLPIVAMTANAMQSDRERCLAAGMNDHLGKPIEPDELWKKLLQWIRPRLTTDSAAPSAPVPVGNTSAIDIPTDIEELDSTVGLRRTLGKHSLYLSQLRKFATTQKQFPEQLNSALASKDLEVAERLVHTLKGLAGNIGAQQLQQDAAAVEAVIHSREPTDSWQPLLQTMTTRLLSLITQLDQKLPQPEPSQPEVSAQIDREMLERVCRQLGQLIEESDAEAVDVIEVNQDLLRAAFAENYQSFYDAIQNFDFDQAFAILQQLVLSQQISLN